MKRHMNTSSTEKYLIHMINNLVLYKIHYCEIHPHENKMNSINLIR